MRCSMPLSLYGFLWSLLLQSLVHSQILSNLIQVEAPGNFSASCSATFNQSIACSLALSRVASGTFIPTSNDLPRICTDACLSELKSLRVQQFSVCNSSDVAVIKGLAYPATYNTDLLLFTYNYACMKDLTSNEYCFPDVWEWNSDTTVMTSTELCSDCNLLIQQAQLESPFGYDDDAASDYSSLTSSYEISNHFSICLYLVEVEDNETRFNQSYYHHTRRTFVQVNGYHQEKRHLQIHQRVSEGGDILSHTSQ
ncbi:uncharacterized protein TrAFT101_001131 [Trichoderma asperellum]|uniref:uncharacterized protein n=1 Tax=Trichoderma asperellum TaxID=101201 RepID=UPI00332C3894|nr:hypothetical protein TrAFT101_001131 [Trichoderma asperellum]